MIKAVFFDIDGTLIDTTTHTIPKSTIQALQQLRKNGFHLGIASGRDIVNMQKIKGLDLTMFDGFVASNGMSIFDHNISPIHIHTYPANDVQHLINYANTHDIALIFETKDDLYVATHINPYVDIANEYYHEITPPQKTWKQEDVLKISCFQDFHYDFSKCLKDVALQVISSPTTTYDLTIQGVSKLSGIHELMQFWNLPIDEFMCFGDHENDIEMIQGAQCGVAVKDPLGSLKLQALADDTCESAGNDGIYKYLSTQGYI